MLANFRGETYAVLTLIRWPTLPAMALLVLLLPVCSMRCSLIILTGIDDLTGVNSGLNTEIL